MAKIHDYGYLFEKMFGVKNTAKQVNNIRMSEISSPAVQAQLRAAGINTNSPQFKAAMASMNNACGGHQGIMFTNIQAIKNQMSSYDSNGDWIDPTTGLTGLLVTDENRASIKRIIDIPESSRETMFKELKNEFLRENGVLNGDTTNRSSWYTNLHRQMKKDDRLAAGYTLSQYERQYRQAFVAAAKAANPDWEIGKPLAAGALDNITRKSVESALIKVGNLLVSKTLDINA